jgi:aryl-alcohol dehydrogenase-like predicted oxidoreductase
VWSPLAGGWLTGKYRRGEEPPPDSRAARVRKFNPRTADRFNLERATNRRKLDLIDELAVIADKAGISLTHMSMAFVLTHPAVTSAIIGPRTMEQLEDVLKAADVTLDADTLDAIDGVVAPGEVVEDADRGWEPPWLSRDARRR